MYQPSSTPPSSGPIRSTDNRTSELVTQVIPTAMQMLLKNSAPAATGAAATASAMGSGAELAGATSSAAGGALATGTASSGVSSVSSWLGVAGKGFGILGGVAGAYDLVSNWGKSTPAQGAMSGAAVGAAIGSFIPVLGTAMGGAIGALVGGMMGTIRAGKHPDQKDRDQVRAAMVERGFLDSNYQLPLANGATYNMGLDGGPKSELGGLRPFEVDFNNPLAAQAVAWINPIADLITGGNEKLKTDFAGYLANASMTGAKNADEVAVNVLGIMQRLNISPDTLQQWVIQSANAGRYQGEDAQVHMGNVQVLGKYFNALSASQSVSH